MFLQRCLVQILLLVVASAWTEMLHAPEKDIVVSKNANVSVYYHSIKEDIDLQNQSQQDSEE